MKSLAIACALLLSAGWGLAQTAAPREPQASPSPGAPSVEMMTAQLVAKDGRARTITVRNLSNIKDRANTELGPKEGAAGDDNNVVLHLDGKVLARLGNVKAGDSIIMTCRSNSSTTTGPNTAPPQPPTPTACVTVTGLDKIKQ